MNCYFNIAPNSINFFLDLLKECAPVGKVAKIKERCNLSEEYNKNDILPLEIFTKVSAYILQSLPITKLEKLHLWKEIQRIYPKDQVDPASFEKIKKVINHIIPAPNHPEEALFFTPVGLDNFEKDFTDITESEIGTILDPSFEENKAQWKEALQSILREYPNNSLSILTTLSNYILLEQYTLELIWKYLEMCRNFNEMQQSTYIPEDPSKFILIRLTEHDLQLLPRNEDFYEKLSIEELSLWVQKKKSYDSFSKNNAIFEKEIRNFDTKKDISSHYLQFSQTIKKHSNKIILKEIEELSPFFTRTILNLEIEFKNQITHLMKLDGPNLYYTKNITPFLIKFTSIFKEHLEEINEKQKNYILPLRPFEFCKKCYALCYRYQQEIEVKKEIYSAFYQEALRMKKKNKNPLIKGAFQLQFFLPNLGKNIVSLPQEMPYLNFSPFKSLTETLIDFYSQKEVSIALKEETTTTTETKTLPQLNSKGSKKKSSSKEKKEQTPSKPIAFIEEKQKLDEDLPLDSEETIEASLKESPSSPQTLIDLLAKKSASSWNYDPRVIKWFHATLPLNPQIFPGYPQDLNYQEKMALFHGFSLEVDSFIEELAYPFTQLNNTTQAIDQCYAIAGEIKTKKECYRGIFYYALGSDGLIYHRFFSQKTSSDIIAIAQKAFYKIDFPKLESSLEDSAPIFLPTNSEDNLETITQDPRSGVIKIHNASKEITISLISLKE